MPEEEASNQENPNGSNLGDKYKEKGIQQLTLKEYEALKNKKAKKFQIPQQIKMVLLTPVLLLFCAGVFFIPYILYLIATGEPPQYEEPVTPPINTQEDLSKK